MVHGEGARLSIKAHILARPAHVDIFKHVNLHCSVEAKRLPHFLFYIFSNSSWETVLNNTADVQVDTGNDVTHDDVTRVDAFSDHAQLPVVSVHDKYSCTVAMQTRPGVVLRGRFSDPAQYTVFGAIM